MKHSPGDLTPEVTDILVVGSGVAGLSAALELARRSSDLRISLLTRGPLGGHGASPLAQGGVAAALDTSDSPERHALDTRKAGDGLANPWLSDILAREGVDRVRELIRVGARFDRGEGGDLLLGLEGAHSNRRILHANGDRTGAEVTRALRAAVLDTDRIDVLEEVDALELLQVDGCVAGVVARDGTGAVRPIHARATLLATGGPGRVYLRTTAPAGLVGDGLAMAARAGARLRDLEFVQFHPTALNVTADPLPLVTEALRGAGARLVDREGRPVTDPDGGGDLSSRDRVARALWTRIRAGDSVFLDARERPGERMSEAFPGAFALCRKYGVDPLRDLIPVTPAAHYHMGGIAVDPEGRTSLPGLWAAGEVAASGLHGANRLGSNSLLEGLVFGPRAAQSILVRISELPSRNGGPPSADLATPYEREPASLSAEVELRIRTVMWESVGVVRRGSELREALGELRRIERDVPQGLPPASISPLLVARLIAAAALRREESLGSHFRSDHPERPRDRPRHLLLSLPAGPDGPPEWEWEDPDVAPPRAGTAEAPTPLRRRASATGTSS